MNQVITTKELTVLKAFIKGSIESACSFSDECNMSWMNNEDVREETGFSIAQVDGILGSLLAKGLIFDYGESMRGAKCNDFYTDPFVVLPCPELFEYTMEIGKYTRGEMLRANPGLVLTEWTITDSKESNSKAPVTSSKGKLSESDVRAIRADNRKQAEIAAQYQIGTAMVSKIKCRTRFAHII